MARNPLKGLMNFLRLLRHMPSDTTGRYNAGAKEIRNAARAVHPPNARGAVGSGPERDKIVGKAIADSHKKARR